jgi:hypothetical protein
MNWIIQNKEWLFSGIGVLIITLFIKKSSKPKKIKQKQKSGANSTNIQVGGNYKHGL